MKAVLKPLDGKYYGTTIEVDFEDGGDKETFKLWDSGDFTPSIRELESLGYTEEQWINNELVDNGWGGKIPIIEMDIVSDSHFESKLTYERALKIVSLLNKGQ